MKKSNNIQLRIVVFSIVFFIACFGIFLWWHDATAPFDPEDQTPVVFTVSSGQSIRDIASRLAGQQLIRSPIGFYLLVKMKGIEKNIQAGEFRLNKTMDSATVAEQLMHGMMDTWVTIIEGWRVEEIATKLVKEFDIPEQEFLTYAIEGYMFPDTYRFPSDASASAIVKQIKDNFDTKVSPVFVKDTNASGLSKSEIIILASIVEREGKTNDDRPVISGILLNRLREGWPLETDATLQYALGYQSSGKTWWKKYLTNEDKLVDSLYNTYMYTGLPPGPISSPGIEAIRAVVHPKKTSYMFYLHDETGQIHYAKTLEEHTSNINMYLK